MRQVARIFIQMKTQEADTQKRQLSFLGVRHRVQVISYVHHCFNS